MDLLFSDDRFVFEDRYRNIYIIAGYENNITIYSRQYKLRKESYGRRFQQMLNRRKNIYENNIENEDCQMNCYNKASFHYKHVNIGLCSKCNDFVFGHNTKLNDYERCNIEEILPNKTYYNIYVAIRNDERVFVLSSSSYYVYGSEFIRTKWNLFNDRVEVGGLYYKIIEPQVFAEVIRRKYIYHLMPFAYIAKEYLVQDIIQLIIDEFLRIQMV